MEHVTHKTNAAAAIAQNKASYLASMDENMIYMMGLSFIVGSLFTILILLLLDFMKRDRVATEID